MINLFTSVKQAQGDTVRPLLLNILGVSINLILDPLFLVIFNWGIGGAALATLLAKIPSAIIGVLVLRGNNQLVRINFKNFKFDKNKVLAILKIGLPTAIGGSTMQFGFLLMTKMLMPMVRQLQQLMVSVIRLTVLLQCRQVE